MIKYVTHICVLASFSLSISSISTVLAAAASDLRAKEFGVATAEFAPTSRSDAARRLVPTNITSQGCPRPAWPRKNQALSPRGRKQHITPAETFRGLQHSAILMLSRAGILLGLGGPETFSLVVSKPAPLSPTSSGDGDQRYLS